MFALLIVGLIIVAVIAISAMINSKSFESDLEKLTTRTITQLQTIENELNTLRNQIRDLENK